MGLICDCVWLPHTWHLTRRSCWNMVVWNCNCGNRMGHQGQWDPALFTKILYWTHTRTSARWPTTVQRTAAPRARGGASSARFIRANYSSQLSKSGLVSGAAPWLKCCTNAPPPFFRAAAGFRPGRSESSSVLPARRENNQADPSYTSAQALPEEAECLPCDLCWRSKSRDGGAWPPEMRLGR